MDKEKITEDIIATLKTIYDPEIPVDIYELGLIYGIDLNDDGDVKISMTLTSPSCPVAETLPPEVESKVKETPEKRRRSPRLNERLDAVSMRFHHCTTCAHDRKANKK